MAHLVPIGGWRLSQRAARLCRCSLTPSVAGVTRRPQPEFAAAPPTVQSPTALVLGFGVGRLGNGEKNTGVGRSSEEPSASARETSPGAGTVSKILGFWALLGLQMGRKRVKKM